MKTTNLNFSLSSFVMPLTASGGENMSSANRPIVENFFLKLLVKVGYTKLRIKQSIKGGNQPSFVVRPFLTEGARKNSVDFFSYCKS